MSTPYTQSLIEQLADELTASIYEDFPEFIERYSERGKIRCREDNLYHFQHLNTAYEMHSVQLFIDYTTWLNGILTSHGMKSDDLIDNYERIRRVIPQHLDGDRLAKYQDYLSAGIETLQKTR